VLGRELEDADEVPDEVDAADVVNGVAVAAALLTVLETVCASATGMPAMMAAANAAHFIMAGCGLLDGVCKSELPSSHHGDQGKLTVTKGPRKNYKHEGRGNGSERGCAWCYPKWRPWEGGQIQKLIAQGAGGYVWQDMPSLLRN
jgi:hypothetical protein